jgi:hypothetical protein
MRRVHASVLAFAAAVSVTPAAAQQRPSHTYEVVVETPRTVETTLRDLMRDGYACEAVARPVGGRLSNNLAVFVSRLDGQRPARLPRSSPVDARVITATAGAPGALEEEMNQAAEQGFTLCGLTMTESTWGAPSEYASVAVMTRADTTPTGSSYRVVRSQGRREDWSLFERAAADGFVVSRLVSRPHRGAVNTSDIIFVAEKTASTRPTRYELAFANNGPALEKEIGKSTKRGFCAQAAWATWERMSVLLAKPMDAACDRQHDYEIDESSRFSVNSADGELLGMFRTKDGVMALYNGSNTSIEYSVIEGELPDPEFRRAFKPREHRLLAEKLDADGERGYRIVDVTWRDGEKDGRSLDIIMSRPRQ